MKKALVIYPINGGYARNGQENLRNGKRSVEWERQTFLLVVYACCSSAGNPAGNYKNGTYYACMREARHKVLGYSLQSALLRKHG